jgi:hypothetical protein
MKTCSKCRIEKPLILFYKRGNGYKSHCKECSSIYGKKYYEINKEIHSKNMSKHYQVNKEQYTKNNKEYREKHKERVSQYSKDYTKKKRNEDLFFRLKGNLRVRIKEYMKTKKITSKNRTFDFVGCEPKILIEYLEKQFNDGINWDNYGKWHIDHKIPLSCAKTEEELYNLCHFTNLQPMWAEENLRKGSKII